MTGRVTALLDLTAPGSGIALIAGAHSFPDSPQALLGATERGGWYIEDAYRDLWPDGRMREDFYRETPPGGAPEDAVRLWVAHLRLDPATVEIRTEREYD